VIETAVGCDRLALALLCDAYREESVSGEEGDTRIVLGLKPYFAPIKRQSFRFRKRSRCNRWRLRFATIFLRAIWWNTTKARASVNAIAARRNRYAVLCDGDFESIEDKKVTVRHRDKMTQDGYP